MSAVMQRILAAAGGELLARLSELRFIEGASETIRTSSCEIVIEVVPVASAGSQRLTPLQRTLLSVATDEPHKAEWFAAQLKRGCDSYLRDMLGKLVKAGRLERRDRKYCRIV